MNKNKITVCVSWPQSIENLVDIESKLKIEHRVIKACLDAFDNDDDDVDIKFLNTHEPHCRCDVRYDDKNKRKLIMTSFCTNMGYISEADYLIIFDGPIYDNTVETETARSFGVNICTFSAVLYAREIVEAIQKKWEEERTSVKEDACCCAGR